jgi:hypothetical protein
MRSNIRRFHRKRRRSICRTPAGADRPPIGGRGRLVVWQEKKTLSWLTPDDRRDGFSRPTVMTQRDSTRVSPANRPSAPPFMSPQPSATRKASPAFSAISCSRPDASTVSPALNRVE